MDNIRFLDDNGAFQLSEPEEVSGLYFPLASETGLKSAVSPNLGGDCKVDQETFLLEPVSVEDLHASRSTRNFWCVTERAAGRPPAYPPDRRRTASPRPRTRAP